MLDTLRSDVCAALSWVLPPRPACRARVRSQRIARTAATRREGHVWSAAPIVRSRPYAGGVVLEATERFVVVRLTHPAHLVDLSTGQDTDYPVGTVVRFASF